MEQLSDAAVFLSLALLAIVITIFVLAASLLGRALQKAREEQQEASQLEKEEAEAQAAKFGEAIAEVQEKLKEVQEKLKKADTSEAVSALEAQLSQYKKERRASEKQLRKAERRHMRYRVLTVSRGVLPTSMLLLCSLVLAALAQPVGGAGGYALLSLSGSLLAYACYRIYQSLRVVQEVAVTTEEAQFKREAEAVEMALERHEERKRPMLVLQFTQPKPPFKLKPSRERELRFDTQLNRGDVARVTELWFIAPREFDFPGSETRHRLANALGTKIELGDLKRGLVYPESLTIKAPSEPGTYILTYYFNCEGYPGKHEVFEIEVVE